MNEELQLDTKSSDNQESNQIIDTTLPNYSVRDILTKCEGEHDLSKEDIPYENVRNNSKIFLIYYAKSQLKRVIKLSNNLEELEDRLIQSSAGVTDPDALMRIISSIESSMNSALKLIDKISTDDSYIQFIFNDNRQIINNLNSTTLNATNNINLSKESRIHLREIAENLLVKVNSLTENGEVPTDELESKENQ